MFYAFGGYTTSRKLTKTNDLLFAHQTAVRNVLARSLWKAKIKKVRIG